MEDRNRNFSSFEELSDVIQKRNAGHILVGYRNIPDYAGMVLGIGIIFDVNQLKYELDLQWISFGLDLFGENLLENYLYQFDDLQALLTYLQSKYHTLVSDIPMAYQIDPDLFPNPIKDSDQRPIFEMAWQKFQDNFQQGVFLDDSLQVVFSTQEMS